VAKANPNPNPQDDEVEGGWATAPLPLPPPPPPPPPLLVDKEDEEDDGSRAGSVGCQAAGPRVGEGTGGAVPVNPCDEVVVVVGGWVTRGATAGGTVHVDDDAVLALLAQTVSMASVKV